MVESVLQAQDFFLEFNRAQNLRSTQAAQLQQSCSLIPSDGVVGLRGVDQIKQAAVCRIDGLVLARQRTRPHGRGVEVVEHDADLMSVKQAAKPGVAARFANLIDLLLAG